MKPFRPYLDYHRLNPSVNIRFLLRSYPSVFDPIYSWALQGEGTYVRELFIPLFPCKIVKTGIWQFKRWRLRGSGGTLAFSKNSYFIFLLVNVINIIASCTKPFWRGREEGPRRAAKEGERDFQIVLFKFDFSGSHFLLPWLLTIKMREKKQSSTYKSEHSTFPPPHKGLTPLVYNMVARTWHTTKTPSPISKAR